MGRLYPARAVFILVPAMAFALAADLVMSTLQTPASTRWLIVAVVFAYACRVGWLLTEFDGRG